MLEGGGTLLGGGFTLNGGVSQEAEVLDDRCVGVEVEASELLEVGGFCVGVGDGSSEHAILLHSDGDVGGILIARTIIAVGVVGGSVVSKEEIKLNLNAIDSGDLADVVGILSGAISSVAIVDGGQSLSGGLG